VEKLVEELEVEEQRPPQQLQMEEPVEKDLEVRGGLEKKGKKGKEKKEEQEELVEELAAKELELLEDMEEQRPPQ